MNILHIDDSHEIRKMYSDMLTLDNHLITSVNNGKEGLDLASVNDYDLILLDMWMPKYSGIEFLHDLKNKRPSELRKVIVTSALQFNENQVQNLLELGVSSVVGKPAEIQKLKSILKKIPKLKN